MAFGSVLSRRQVLAASLAAPAVLRARPGFAQGGPLRIGILNDQGGPLADIGGLGSVEAARMAVADFGATALGRPVEILAADHQNKPEVGLTIARRWFDQDGVEMVTDLTNSSIALAVQHLGHEKKKVTLVVTAGATALTGAQCSPTGAQWVYDTYASSYGLVRSMLGQGQDSWFFITVDYAFGQNLVDEATKALAAGGGKVLGSVKHPLNTSDFASYLLQAQASGAKVIGLANSNADFINCVKQAAEFGIGAGGQQRLAATVVSTPDLKAIGLQRAAGLSFVNAWYWDLNDETRAWSKRFFDRRQAMPTEYQVGTYSAVLHYLKAVVATGTSEAGAVMAAMRKAPIDDVFCRGGTLRPDGRMVHDMYLMNVKTAAESKGPFDVMKVAETIPGEIAFRPLKDSACPLVKS